MHIFLFNRLEAQCTWNHVVRAWPPYNGLCYSAMIYEAHHPRMLCGACGPSTAPQGSLAPQLLWKACYCLMKLTTGCSGSLPHSVTVPQNSPAPRLLRKTCCHPGYCSAKIMATRKVAHHCCSTVLSPTLPPALPHGEQLGGRRRLGTEMCSFTSWWPVACSVMTEPSSLYILGLTEA